MKKLIALFISCLLCFGSAGFAESLDLSSMTLEELVELRRQITVKINEKLVGSDDVFYPYDYLVGKHIPAGWYLITCVEVLNDPAYSATIAAWAEGESNWSCHTVEYVEAGDLVLVELAQGDTLRIEDCTVTLKPYRLPTL